MDSPDVDGYAARHFAGLNETCGATLETAEDPPRYVNTEPGTIQVIAATEGDDAVALDIDTELSPVMVMCSRLDIIPAPNDYKIVDSGLTLYLSDAGQGHAARIGILDKSDGGYVFIIFEGEPPDADLQCRIDARLASFPG